MEKINHNNSNQGETVETSRKQQEAREGESAGDQAKEMLEQAIGSVGEIFSQVKAIEEVSSPSERRQAKGIKREASGALSTLYKKFRKLALPLTLLLGGGYVAYSNYTKKEAVHYSDKQHLDRDKLTPGMAIVDTYLTSDLVDTYNKCVDFLQARKDGKMSKEEIAFKEQIVQSIRPYGYGSMPPIDDLQRLHQIKSGKPLFTKESLLRDNEESSGDGRVVSELKGHSGQNFMVRVDLFRKYLGLEQYFDTVQPSEYKPTKAKDMQSKYYKFDTQKVIKSILTPRKAGSKESGEMSDKNKALEDRSFEGLVAFVNKNNIIPVNDFTWQLGEYKAYVGFDKEKNEPYVSYYDVWDLDPPQLKTLGIDIDQFNFPFELYGRIYKSDFEKFLLSQQITDTPPQK